MRIIITNYSALEQILLGRKAILAEQIDRAKVMSLFPPNRWALDECLDLHVSLSKSSSYPQWITFNLFGGLASSLASQEESLVRFSREMGSGVSLILHIPKPQLCQCFGFAVRSENRQVHEWLTFTRLVQENDKLFGAEVGVGVLRRTGCRN